MTGRFVNTIIEERAFDINNNEVELTRAEGRTLTQLRTGKSPLLSSYKNKINPTETPSPNSPLCDEGSHTTARVYRCKKIPTALEVKDLWAKSTEAAQLLWESREKISERMAMGF